MAPTNSQSDLVEIQAKSVLAQFFSSPNVFSNPLLAMVDREPALVEVPSPLKSAISRYGMGLKDRPLLIPFASDEVGCICWFACAHDEIGARALVDEMTAFIGPSFADFETSGASLSSLQKSVKGMLCLSGLHPISLFGTSSSSDLMIIKRWQVYWDLLDQRPPRPRQDFRTFNQMRAAFDRALIARNEKDAKAAMSALRDQHGLSSENRAFLDIRMHAAFERWDLIVTHPHLDDLLKVRLPPETYGDIWDALYGKYVAPFESDGIARRLIQEFSDNVRVPASPLLRSRGRSRRPSALKSFLLHELSVESPSAELCASLLEQLGSEGFGRSSAEIRGLVSALQPKSGLDHALKEMEFERYEQAVALLFPIGDTMEVLQAILRCAKEIGNPSIARKALDRLNASSYELLNKVRSARARLIVDLEKIASEEVSTSLEEQLATQQSQKSADDVVVYWREIAKSLEGDELLKKPSFIAEFVERIEDFALDQSPLFESLLPIWFSWLIDKTEPRGTLLTVYEGLIEALYARDRLGDSEREMIKMAIRHCLIAGLGQGDYIRVVDRLVNAFPDFPSPRVIAWALDLADMLVIHSCRDLEARLRWITRTVHSAVSCFARLSVADRVLLRLLAKDVDLDLPGFTDDQIEEEIEGAHVGARILLYSLDTQSIQ